MMLLQESAAAIALAAGAEGPEHLKDAEARLKKLDKELQEERQCVLELPPFFILSRTASFRLTTLWWQIQQHSRTHAITCPGAADVQKELDR